MTCCTAYPYAPASINVSKTRAESLPIEAQWTPVLTDDSSVTASAWTYSPGGLVLTDAALDSPLTSVVVSGGAPGQVYAITNTVTITTDDAPDQVVTQSFQLYITPAVIPGACS